MPVDALLASPDVDIVLNLTIPAAHAAVARGSIAAGKPVYGEKPLAPTTDEARRGPRGRDRAGVRVGCAPDTVLGTGIQTARKAVDDGRDRPPDRRHRHDGHARPRTLASGPRLLLPAGRRPAAGHGPVLRHRARHLLGPVVATVGAASHTRPTRTIGGGPRKGEVIPVTTDSHVTGVLEHAYGALSTLFMSFDAVATRSRWIEVHGDAAP